MCKRSTSASAWSWLPIWVCISAGACRDTGRDSSAAVCPTVAEQTAAALPAVVRVRTHGAQSQGDGSGFFIRGERGGPLVVTNHHVIWGAEEILIERADGYTDTADVLGVDTASDLALLTPRTNRAPKALTLADDSSVHVGDWLISVGSPAGIFGAASFGILSARSRVPGATVPAQKYVDHIFTAAALGPGGSGGPVLDLRGLVVGISVARAGTIQGLGIAIPSSLASLIFGDLQRTGRSQHSSAGLDVVDDIGSNLPLGSVRVVSTMSGGAAESELQPGDRILSVGGRTLRGAADFRNRIFNAAPDSELKLEASRDGRSISPFLRLQPLPASE